MAGFLKKWAPALLGVILLPACTPTVFQPGTPVQIARLTEHFYVTQDGAKLGLHRWLPKATDIHAVIIALHGFNDYGYFFNQPAQFFADYGIASYAYDQRGFGTSPRRGLWAGVDAYADDLITFSHVVAERHPDTPIFFLGSSMGGAVVLVAGGRTIPRFVSGVILAAPAVWGRATMPWYQNVLLAAMSHSLPWMTLTGEGLGVQPSDNIEMLKVLGRDPLVIKDTRVDAIYGLVNLMDAAFDSSNGLKTKTLLLYGAQDEIIPAGSIRKMISNVPRELSPLYRIALYPRGYHMLLRDLAAETVWRDIVAWIANPDDPLPSRGDLYAEARIFQELSGGKRESDGDVAVKIKKGRFSGLKRVLGPELQSGPSP